jgi:hypothetical protein
MAMERQNQRNLMKMQILLELLMATNTPGSGAYQDDVENREQTTRALVEECFDMLRLIGAECESFRGAEMQEISQEVMNRLALRQEEMGRA